MKKIFSTLFVLLILTNAIFSKTWTNNVGVGLSSQYSVTGVDDKNLDDKKQLGFGAEGTYIGVHSNGFSVKANIAVGLATSKDIAIQDRKTNIGAFENVAIGAGYSFVHSERALFGATAMLGVEMGQYSVDSEDVIYEGVPYDTLTTTLSLLTCSVGEDIFGIFRLSPRFGLFANLSARYIFVGNATTELKYESNSKKRKSDDTELFGKFIVQPTLGVIWTF